MLAYSPLFTPPNGSEWCGGAFDDPSIYYNGLQELNTQNQYFPFDRYNDHPSSFDDQLIIPPPSSPMIFPSLPTPLDVGQTSTMAVSSGVAAAKDEDPEEEEMRDEKKKKKQDHNASERNRRMRINDLYSSLRSLLPATDQMKKLSIPNTVGRALKYIPELQNEVQELIERKEKLLPTASVFSQAYNNNNTNRKTISSSPTTSTSVEATQLGNGEISIQISSLKSNTVVVPISEVLRELEEECGIVIVDVSSSESSAGRVFHRVHLMAEATDEMKCELLREKVLSLSQRWESIYRLWMN